MKKIDAKLDNLMEMDKFPITYSLPRLNHERTVNQNISVMSKEIKSVIQQGMDTHSWTLSTLYAEEAGGSVHSQVLLCLKLARAI